MKHLLLLLCVVLMTACSYKPDPETMYVNVDCEIVSFGQPTPETTKLLKDACLSVMLKLPGEDLYCELSTCDEYQILSNVVQKSCGCTSNESALDGKWFYAHKVGDKVHFDYIRKERFFKGRPEEVNPQKSSDSNSLSLSFLFKGLG